MPPKRRKALRRAPQAAISPPVINSRRILTEFIARQTANPYYTFITILFSAIIAALALWLAVIVPVVISPTLVHLNNLPQILKDRGDLSYPSAQLLLSLFMFLYTVHLWLYFSRVFILVRETPFGEVLTFLLCFVLLASASALPFVWTLWPWVLATCTLLITIKDLHLWWSLRSANVLLPVDQQHPFYKWSIEWTRSAAYYTCALVLVGYFQGRLAKVGYRDWEVIGLALLLATMFVTQGYRRLEKSVSVIEEYVTKNPSYFV